MFVKAGRDLDDLIQARYVKNTPGRKGRNLKILGKICRESVGSERTLLLSLTRVNEKNPESPVTIQKLVSLEIQRTVHWYRSLAATGLFS